MPSTQVAISPIFTFLTKQLTKQLLAAVKNLMRI